MAKELPENKIIKKMEQYVKKRIKNPVISRRECPIPGIYYMSAFAKSDLVVDPIIPDNFFANSKGEISEHFVLEWVNYLPSTKEEAIQVARWLLHAEYGNNIQIKQTKYKQGNTDTSFTVIITADYFKIHPFFEKDPITDQIFNISCTDGKWHISDNISDDIF